MGKLREKYKGFNYFSTLKVDIIKLNSDNIKQISKKKDLSSGTIYIKVDTGMFLHKFYISKIKEKKR